MRFAGSIATLVLLSILVTACSRPPAFQGTALDPPRAALDFTLTDQFGHVLRFAELREKVVVLTFLYTACPDICPLVTQKVRDVAARLGDRWRDVAIIAVTVDPVRDTVAQAAAYSQQWDMLDRWHFLTGSEAALTPLWRYYWVGDVHREAVGSAGPAGYNVAHSAPVHLIDQRGRVRVVYGSGFGPAELIHDIEILLQVGEKTLRWSSSDGANIAAPNILHRVNPGEAGPGRGSRRAGCQPARMRERHEPP